MDSADTLQERSPEETIKDDQFYRYRESRSKTHVRLFQQKLDELSGPDDTKALDVLKKRLDIQLAIEDLTIKSRSAGHPMLIIYGPLGIPVAVSLLGFLAGYFSRGH